MTKALATECYGSTKTMQSLNKNKYRRDQNLIKPDFQSHSAATINRNFI